MQLSSLDASKTYSYADYYQWRFNERVELIDGKVYEMMPAPNRYHQKVSFNIGLQIGIFLRKGPCEVYDAPFDVRLPRESKNDADKDIPTVLQPDICVICDPSKLDKRGCIGAPDIVVEILSPGNSAKEMKLKFSAYEDAGVKEYWIVSIHNQYVLVNILQGDKYVTLPPKIKGDMITTSILPGFSLDLNEVFRGLEEGGE